MDSDQRPGRKKRRLTYENRITLFALVCILPAVLAVALLLVFGNFSSRVEWTVLLMLGSWLLIGVYLLRSEIVYPLRTVANLLAALREEDYSIRARGAKADDALGEVLIEVNQLGASLREQRITALEATALVRAVIAELDVAIFDFDRELRLRLINRAGERLLASASERLIGKTAHELGLGEYLLTEELTAVEA